MPTRIAILYPTSVPWVARYMDGIHLYAKTQGSWHIFGSPPSLSGAGETAMNLKSLRGWKGDGIIIASNDEEELRYARKICTPVINLAGGLRDPCGIPRVMVDHYEAGRMAAEHLLERGLPHLGFFGWKNLWYSEERYRGLCERAAESEVKCDALLHSVSSTANLSWTQRITNLKKWIKSIPLPCGIFAMNDFRALLLMEACYEAGLRIPDDIAIIGMDNNEVICEHSAPSLTSIARSSEQVGYETAVLLDRMIRGESNLPQELLIPPSGVILRKSSDMLYCSDPLVRLAIEYMRKHLQEQFNMEAIAEHLNISKRKLERKFSEAINSSPRQYLIKLRVQHAKVQMQLHPEQTNEDIAIKCGFGRMPSFYSAFQHLTGTTPTAYRSRNIKPQQHAL